jgi:hypothetical protein
MQNPVIQQFLTLDVKKGVSVAIFPDESQHFFISNKDVALGYNVTENNLLLIKRSNVSEFKEGIHYVTGALMHQKCQDEIGEKLYNWNRNQIFWTKQGIIRLSFFIKTQAAISFRDYLEQLVTDGLLAKEISLPQSIQIKGKYYTFANLSEVVSIASSVAGSIRRLSKIIFISHSTLQKIMNNNFWSLSAILQRQIWLHLIDFLKRLLPIAIVNINSSPSEVIHNSIAIEQPKSAINKQVHKSILSTEEKLDIVALLLKIEDSKLRLELFEKIKKVL